eukprot:6408344-Prymnesium_polylepis.2
MHAGCRGIAQKLPHHASQLVRVESPSNLSQVTGIADIKIWGRAAEDKSSVRCKSSHLQQLASIGIGAGEAGQLVAHQICSGEGRSHAVQSA